MRKLISISILWLMQLPQVPPQELFFSLAFIHPVLMDGLIHISEVSQIQYDPSEIHDLHAVYLSDWNHHRQSSVTTEKARLHPDASFSLSPHFKYGQSSLAVTSSGVSTPLTSLCSSNSPLHSISFQIRGLKSAQSSALWAEGSLQNAHMIISHAYFRLFRGFPWL